MKVALAQINTTVGDLSGNGIRILQAYGRAAKDGVDVVVFPELAITGYPPRDLLLKKSFVDANLTSLKRVAEATGDVGLIVGYVGWHTQKPGRDLMNCVALCQNGTIVSTRAKILLPSYDVFDEDRYFEPGPPNGPIDFKDKKIGLTVCEDIWNDDDFWRDRRYRSNPAVELAAAGAEIIFNISASPWHVGKHTQRVDLLKRLCKRTRTPIVYCNLVGGNDELLFDGASLVLNNRADIVSCGPMFAEDVILAQTDTSEGAPFPAVPDEEKIFRALVMGVRDYLFKCGFRTAVLGLSGGIDSAVTACIAADALGKENVFGVSMPSQYSSAGSLEDAKTLATRLGIRYQVIPIQSPFESVKEQLKPAFEGLAEDATEENIQARLRGMVLMALSNKLGSMVLTTGNKSELAVGYCTLYGDMCGGLAVISDLPKAMVYRLAKWINKRGETIPRNSISKPPSAELRPHQTDQDSLPPYDEVDAVVEGYVVEGQTPAELVASGISQESVARVVALIDRNEYKRRQAAPGLKVTGKAFGAGRRYPIAQRFRER